MNMKRMTAAVFVASSLTMLGGSVASAAPPAGGGQNQPKCEDIGGTWDQATSTCLTESTYNNGNDKTKGQVFEKDKDPAADCTVNPAGKEHCS